VRRSPHFGTASGILDFMPKPRSSTLTRVLQALAAILLAKVVLSVLVEYRDYFPPNFDSDFLRGPESYFWGAYQWAFFTHVIAGPAALVLGAILISERFRQRVPAWHRRLGRVQGTCVLLLVVPSGLWMAGYAETGAVAAAGLGSLAIATAACMSLGWKAAVARRFVDHRRWMSRAFLLLCWAVVIRMIGGLATVLELDAPWMYPLSTWAVGSCRWGPSK
jgi:hypothetical protein